MPEISAAEISVASAIWRRAASGRYLYWSCSANSNGIAESGVGPCRSSRSVTRAVRSLVIDGRSCTSTIIFTYTVYMLICADIDTSVKKGRGRGNFFTQRIRRA